MSAIKISELQATTEANDESYIPIDNGEITYKIKVGDYNSNANATAKSYAESAGTSATAAEASAASAATTALQVKNSTTAAASSALAAESSVTRAQSAAESASASAASASTYSQSAQGSANFASTNATSSSNSALMAQSWAVGGTGLRPDEDTNNANYYASVAGAAAGGGVVSFNGRGGVVTPKEGDYNATQIVDGATNVHDEIDSLNALVGNEDLPTGSSTITGAISNLRNEIEEAAAKEFNRFYGMCTKTTSIATVNGNKVITENDTGELVQTVTTISTVATGKQIVAVVTPTSGSYNYRKTVLIEKSNGTTTITESYVKEAK